MLRLLLSLMPPQEGELYLSARQAEKTIALTPSARKLFSYVPQGNTMFSGTIAENMRNVKPDATEEEIIEVLKTACAWEFVEKLPEGIYSMIKERGGGFSEGQAQRLAIARAVLSSAPILLLDECTSALDVDIEQTVLSRLKALPGRTCIAVTHRPAAIALCDWRLEVADGKIHAVQVNK